MKGYVSQLQQLRDDVYKGSFTKGRRTRRKRKLAPDEQRPSSVVDVTATYVHSQESGLKSTENVISVVEDDVDENAKHLLRIRGLRSEAERNIGTHVNLTDGFVYIAINPVYGGWFKVGMTLDYEERISTYNTSCPFDGFKMLVVAYVSDRRAKEVELLAIFADHALRSKGEWFEITKEKAIALFTSVV